MGKYHTDNLFITEDGHITLPEEFKPIFGHKVKADFDITEDKKKSSLNFPVYYCGGKLNDFSREDLYEQRF